MKTPTPKVVYTKPLWQQCLFKFTWPRSKSFLRNRKPRVSFLIHSLTTDRWIISAEENKRPYNFPTNQVQYHDIQAQRMQKWRLLRLPGTEHKMSDTKEVLGTKKRNVGFVHYKSPTKERISS